MFSTRFLADSPLFVTSRLHIRGIGIRETMPAAFIARPRGSGDCLIMMFHSRVQLGDARGDHPSGTIALWQPGAGQFYGNRTERWSHSWVHCDGDLVAQGVRDGDIGAGEPILLRNPARVERYLLDLYEELRGEMAGTPSLGAGIGAAADGQIVENTLLNLLREAARSRAEPQWARPPRALMEARATIEAHYDQKLTLEILAAAAHLSVPHFCSAFKRWFGVPPISYLIRRRMEAAALLLSGTALDVSEVGRRVGYDDPYHFSKLFSQTFGMAPTRFRGRGVAPESDLRTRYNR